MAISTSDQKRIVITSGEPAGIGPDVLLAAVNQPSDAQIIALGDRGLLQSRAALLGLNVRLTPTPAPTLSRHINLADCR